MIVTEHNLHSCTPALVHYVNSVLANGSLDTSWTLTPSSTSNAPFFRQVVSNDNSQAWIATSNGVYYVSGVGATPTNLWATNTFDLNLDTGGQLWSVNAGAGAAHNSPNAFPTTSAGATSLTLLTATAATGIVAQTQSLIWFTGYSTGLSLLALNVTGTAYIRPSNWSSAQKIYWNAANGVAALASASAVGARGITGWNDAFGNFVLYICTGVGTTGAGGNVIVSFNTSTYTGVITNFTFVPIAQAPVDTDFRGIARVAIVPSASPTSSLTPAGTGTATSTGTSTSSSSSSASPSTTSGASAPPSLSSTAAATTTPSGSTTPASTPSSTMTPSKTPTTTSTPTATTTPGTSIAVLRVGSGAAALATGVAAPLYYEVISAATGNVISTVAVPSTGGQACTQYGLPTGSPTLNDEGLLSVSLAGTSNMMPCWSTAAGSTINPATDRLVIARCVVHAMNIDCRCHWWTHVNIWDESKQRRYRM